jgi:CRP/FNR family transcriptional regulator, cyclic AMP receptor protein
MKTIAEYLKNVRLFADLTDAQRERIAAVCRRRRYAGKVSLFYEEDHGGQLYIILTGGVKIFMTNGDTGQETILALLAPGDIFGEMALFLGGKRSASAITIAENTELLILDQESFQSLLRESFELTFEMMRNLAGRLKEANKHLKDVVENSSTARLAKFLLARCDPQTGKLCPPLSQDEIASIIGTRRETVARNLKELEKAHCLLRNHGHLQVTNFSALKGVAKRG